jgi:DNA ligase-1
LSTSTKLPSREFLQLAHPFKPDKQKIAGWYISEKLDGQRCFWDGGVTRGLPTDTVPWAGVTDPKTKERKAKVKPIATGLWSRYGNPIIAPDWFLNALPACPLDGELWAGRGKFQLTVSICGGDNPDPRFNKISYAVYSSPPLASIFATGEIKNSNMVREVDRLLIESWLHDRLGEFDGDFRSVPANATFDDELMFLRGAIDTQNDHVFLHRQVRLSINEAEAREQADRFLNEVLDQGGEGGMLRNPAAVWTPKRHNGILKWKPFDDAEGTIVGFTSGRETAKGSRLRGKIGALILDYQGKRLELAGLTDDEREFYATADMDHAREHPGEEMPSGVKRTKHFKVGQTVTFKFRELTDDGIPKEARYWRKRGVE